MKKTFLFSSKFVCALAFILLNSGCLNLFSEKSRDESVLQRATYRRVNTACGGMNLATSVMDVPTFRSMIKCFNANGALEEIDRLLNNISDQDLAPVVEMTNSLVLDNKKRLYEIERTHTRLDDLSILDSAYRQVGDLLSNTEFIVSAIQVLKAGFDQVPDPGLPGQPDYNQDILKAIELVSQGMTPSEWGKILDYALTLADAPAFQGLSRRLGQFTQGAPDLRLITDHVYDFLRSDHNFKSQLTEVLKSGELFELANEVSGKTPDLIKANIPKLIVVLQESLKKKPGTEDYLLSDLSRSFRDLNQEIRCTQGANTIPNGAMHILNEWLVHHNQDPSRYFLQELPLTMVALNPFCELPPGLAETYPSLRQMAENGIMIPMTDRLSRVYQGLGQGLSEGVPNENDPRKFIRLLVEFLADEKFDRLIPAMVALNHKDAWGDLLLVLATPSDDMQAELKKAVRILFEQRQELRGQSVNDVFLNALTANSPGTLYRFVSSLKNYLDRPEPVLEPALRILRQGYYSNNLHPFLDMLQDVGGQAVSHSKFFKSLFKISGDQNFEAAVRRISDMAKDGSLKELTTSMVTLFHKFAVQGAEGVSVEDLTAPEVLSSGRHHLRWARAPQSEGRDSDRGVLGGLLGVLPRILEEQRLEPILVEPLPASYQPMIQNCRNLDLSFSLAQVEHPQHAENLTRFLNCMNSDGRHDAIAQFVEFLRQHRTQDQQDFFSFQVQLVRDLVERRDDPSSAVNPAEIRYLTDRWQRAYNQSQFDAITRAIPFWIGETTGIVEPILYVTQSLLPNAQQALRNLEKYGATLLRRNDFPQLLGDLDFLTSGESPNSGESSLEEGANDSGGGRFLTEQKLKENGTWAEIAEWVRCKECADFHPSHRGYPRTEEEVEARVREIIEEANQTVNTWELLNHSGVKRPRQEWTENGLKGLLKDRLFKILRESENVQPSHESAARGVIEAQLNFLKSFDDLHRFPVSDTHPFKHSHFTVDYLLDWLYERATDYRLITYYHEGEDLPRVKYVNSLDLLDMVVIDVDFPMPLGNIPIPPFGKNLGLDFLAEIGDAWGDVPNRNEWPQRIQDMYPAEGRKKPKRLFEAIRDIVNRPATLENLAFMSKKVGLPKFPSCYKNLPGSDASTRGPNALDPQADSWISWPFLQFRCSSHEVEMIQRHLYNLQQVTPILLENTPVLPWDEKEMQELEKIYPKASRRRGKGMEVLRNLFSELRGATPTSKQNAYAGDDNYLSTVRILVKLGALRQIGRMVQDIDRHDPAVKDFVLAVLHSAQYPEMKSILTKLVEIKNGDLRKGQELLWKLIVDIMKIIKADSQGGGSAISQNLQRTAFYSMVAMNRLDPMRDESREAGQEARLTRLLLQRTLQILEEQGDFLFGASENLMADFSGSSAVPDLLKRLIENPNPDRDERFRSVLWDAMEGDRGSSRSPRVEDVFQVLKALYPLDGGVEGVEGEAGSTPWARFQVAWKNLQNNEQYRSLNLGAFVRPLLNFFEERPSSGEWLIPESEQRLRGALALKIRSYLAELLDSGKAHEFVVLAGQNPEQFSLILKNLRPFLDRNDERGRELEEFFEMVHRSLPAPE